MNWKLLIGGVGIGIGAALLVYALTHLVPVPPGQNEHTRVIDSLNRVIDSLDAAKADLLQERQRLLEKMKRDSADSEQRDQKQQVEISRREQTIRYGTKNIRNFPTPRLDSIVTVLYGPGAFGQR